MKTFAGGLWVTMGIVLMMAGCAPKLDQSCQSTQECNAGQVCAAGHCVSAGQIDGEVPTADGTNPDTDARPDSMTSPDGETDGDRITDAQLLDAAREDGTVLDASKDATPDVDINPPPNDALLPPIDQGTTLDALPRDATLPPPADAVVGDPDAGDCESGCLCNPGIEICDGLDNDCDGQTDEDFLGLDQPCFSGRGICQVEGVNVCSPDTMSVVCDATPGRPGVEICDDLDNDCDGDVDNGLNGQVEECGLGACAHSVTACNGGDLAICNPFEGEMAEVCNGIDDDCDGAVDNGVLNACGLCGPPPVEICDGIDNNCDGQTDEGEVCSHADAGPPPDAAPPPPDAAPPPADAAPPPADAATDATLDAGPIDAELLDATADAAIDAEPICVPSTETCNGLDDDCDGAIDNGVQNACGLCGPPPAETCNDLDDDCDGQTDEDSNVECRCADRPDMPYMRICQDGVLQPCPCAELCNSIDDDGNGTVDDVMGLGQPCSQGVGACRVEGIQECDLALGALTCSAQELPPIAEICDHLDNDCDSVIDNGVLNACGLCGSVPDEICDGADNDCDGVIDNNTVDVGAACQSGVGTCQAQGNTICQDGHTACDALPGNPGVEICNRLDDDCDGTIDNGLSCPTWINIPAGPFYSHEGLVENLVAYQVTENFMTKAQYNVCVNAGACTLPQNSNQVGLTCNWQAIGRDDYPINCINVSQAQAVCAYYGGRLPSRLEYEKAARGGCERWGTPNCEQETDHPIYPFGDQAPVCAQLLGHFRGCAPLRDTRPVTDLPAAISVYGMYHPIGLLRRFTSDSSAQGNHLVVGGGFDDLPSPIDNQIPRNDVQISADLGVICAGNLP